MAFNGSGTFDRVYNWVTDKANSVKITASRFDTETDGIATGLSTCITKDGQTTVSANIPMNSKKFTGLTVGSDRTDSISLGQVQDGTYLTLGTAGGSADTYTASPSPSITAYATGSRFILKIQADNTGASTLDISTVGAKNIKKYDGAGAKVDPEAGDLQQDQYYDIFYDGTDIVVLNPQFPYIGINNLSKSTTSTYGVSILPNQITTSNGTDADHDIDFTAGNFTFSGGDGQAVASALTKQADATWAAGDAAGGLADALTIAIDTTYHCFALSSADGTTVDFGFDTSVTATNLLADTAVIAAGLTKFKRIASLITDGSANILPGTFYFNPDGTYTFIFQQRVISPDGITGTSANTINLDVPQGLKLEAIGILKAFDNATASILISSFDDDDVAASSTNSDLTTPSNSSTVNTPFRITTNTSSQIRGRASTSSISSITFLTRGWFDNKL